MSLKYCPNFLELLRVPQKYTKSTGLVGAEDAGSVAAASEIVIKSLHEPFMLEVSVRPETIEYQDVA